MILLSSQNDSDKLVNIDNKLKSILITFCLHYVFRKFEISFFKGKFRNKISIGRIFELSIPGKKFLLEYF